MRYLHVIWLLTVLALPAAANPGPWTTVRDDEGIHVERRAAPPSAMHEFRARAIVEGAIPAVLAVIQDHGHAKDWMYNTEVSRVLERVDARTEIVYERSGAPWPVADRDVVLKAEMTCDPGAKQVRLELEGVESAKMTPVDGVVRMPLLRGHWYLTAEHGGEWTRVEYQLHVDPGGSIPGWMVNNGSKKVPFVMLKSLREQVRKHASAALEKELAARPDIQAVLAAAQ